MNIRSGRGDRGYTELLSEKRVSKDSDAIQAIGDLDELNAHIGLVKCKTRKKKFKEILENIQRNLGVIASEIAVGAPKRKKLGLLVKKEHADWIESIVNDLENTTLVECHFSLPGEDELSALFDITRAVARRTERSMVGLFRRGRIENDYILSYLNCLSDILFIIPRAIAQKPKKKRTKKTKRKK